jgi:haloalkane dehalogenase
MNDRSITGHGRNLSTPLPQNEDLSLSNSTEQSRYKKQYISVHGKRMAYVDVGEGDPIVFLHGNPTSSFLWRNVMPYMEGKGRLIAPDLVGMGDSEKLDNSNAQSYTYVEHRKYLFALLESLGVNSKVTLVVHDWGAGLGFHWAQKNPDAVKGIAFMEAIAAPVPSWDTFPQSAVETFQGFRSPAGEQMILEQNLFIEGVLPGMVLRDLSEAEMTEYRRPYLQAGEDRRPTLTWPRQLPIEGEPADVVQIVTEYGQWLSQSQIPKLFVNAEPGALIVGEVEDFVRSWPAITEVTVPGLHFVQEDSADLIGEALVSWFAQLGG